MMLLPRHLYSLTTIFFLLMVPTSLALPKMQPPDRINFSDYYNMSAYSRCIVALLGNQENNYLSRSMDCNTNQCLCNNLSNAYEWAEYHMRKNTNCAEENEYGEARKMLGQYCGQVRKSSDGTTKTTATVERPSPTSSSDAERDDSSEKQKSGWSKEAIIAVSVGAPTGLLAMFGLWKIFHSCCN